MKTSSRDVDRFPQLDLMRALSVIWVVLFHSIYLLGYLLPADRFLAFAQSGLGQVLLSGHFGVDVFFVMSGFLITNLLLKELDATGTLKFRRFFIRRIGRLFPAYLLAIALYAVLVQTNNQNLWSNVLYINNFFPEDKQPMLWAWSLAVEEQFYLICPFVILGLARFRFKKQIAFLATLIFIAFIIRALLLTHYDIHLPISLHPVLGRSTYQVYFDHLYDKPYSRYGSIVCGMLVAYIWSQRRNKFWNQLVRLRVPLNLSSWIGILCLALISPYQHRFTELFPVHSLLYLTSYRYVFSLLLAVLLLSSLLKGEIKGERSGRFVSLPIWNQIARLSYSAYLFHPFVIILTGVVFLKMNALELRTYPLYGGIVMCVTFLISSLVYRWVERPVRQWIYKKKADRQVSLAIGP